MTAHTVEQQLSFVELYGCTTCRATGRVTNHETGETRSCPTCRGAGTLDYDPKDVSEIPY